MCFNEHVDPYQIEDFKSKVLIYTQEVHFMFYFRI